MATWVFNNAQILSLTGSTGASIALLPNAAMTIETWFQTNVGGPLFALQTSSGALALQVEVGPAGIISVMGSGVALTTGQPTSAADGSWRHLAVALSSSGAAIILDGELLVSGTGTAVSATTLVVGLASSQATAGGFQGALSTVRVWNTALSAAEVEAARYLVLPNNQTSLFGAWPFGDGTFNNALGGGAASPIGSPTFLASNLQVAAPSYNLTLGSGDSASTSVGASFAFGAGDFSIASWVQTSAGGTIASYAGTAGVGEDGSWQLTAAADGTVALTLYASGAQSYSSPAPTSLANGGWNRVLVARASGTLQIYIEGAPVLAPGQSCPQSIGVSDNPALTFGPAAAQSAAAIPDTEGGDVIPAATGAGSVTLTGLSLWSMALDPVADILNASALQPSGAAGLVGYWPLALGCVIDESGAGLGMATLVGSPQVSSGAALATPAIYALTQEAGAAGLVLGQQAAYATGAASLSIEAVVSSTSAAAETVVLFSTIADSGGVRGQGVEVAIEPVTNATGNWSVTIIGAGGSASPYQGGLPAPLFDGNLHHLVFVLSQSPSTVTVYVDGISSGPTTIGALAIAQNDGAFIATGDALSPNGPFVGSISRLRYWPMALAQTDVQSLMAGTAELSAQPLGDWRFYPTGAVDFSTLANSSASSPSATLQPAPAPFSPPGSFALVLNQGGLTVPFNSSSTPVWPNRDFTVQLWFMPFETAQNCNLFAMFNGCLTINMVDGVVNVTTFQWSSTTFSGVTVLQPGVWYNIAVTLNVSAGGGTLYINGVQDGSGPTADYNAALPQGDPYIWFGGSGNVVSGQYAFVSVLFGQLSAAEVAASMYDLQGGYQQWIWWNFTSGQLQSLSGAPYAIDLTALQGGTASLALAAPPPLNDPEGAMESDAAPSALLFASATNQGMLSTASSTSLTFAGSFTLETYFKLEGNPTTSLMTLAGVGPTGYCFNVYKDTSGNWQCAFHTDGLVDGTGAADLLAPAGTSGLQMGAWYYIAGVFDASASTKTVYLWPCQSPAAPAQLLSSVATGMTGSIQYGSSVFGIGGLPAATNPYVGWLRDVRAWSVARSAQDIGFGLGCTVAASLPTLEGYWSATDLLPAVGGGSVFVPDLSGNGNSATPSAGTTSISGQPSDLLLGPPLPSLQIASALIQDWNQSDVSAGNLAGTPRFRSIITVADGNGAPMPGCQVRLWAVDGSGSDFSGVTVSVGSRQYLIGPSQAAELTTDIFGTVSVVMDPQGLGAPALQVWAAFMPENERIVIMPDEDVLDQLGSVTGSDLQSGANPVLSPTSFNATQAGQVAGALNSMAGSVQWSGATLSRKYARKLVAGIALEDLPGTDVVSEVYLVEQDAVFAQTIDLADVAEQFAADYSASGFQVIPLSSAQHIVERRSAKKHYDLRHLDRGDPDGAIGWDLWDSFVEATTQAVSMTFEIVSNAVVAVVEFADQVVTQIVDTVTTVGETIVGMIGQALKVVGQVASDIFDAVVRFFARVFDMDAILAIKSAMDQGITTAIQGLSTNLQSVLANAQSVVAQASGAIQQQLQSLSQQYGALSLGGMGAPAATATADAGTGKRLAAAVMGGSSVEIGTVMSWVSGGMTGSSGANGFEQVFTPANSTTVVDAITSIESDFAPVLASLNAALTDLGMIFGDPENASQWAFQALLDVASAIVQALAAVIQELLAALASAMTVVLDGLIAALTTPVEVPILSWLVEQFTGQPLTALSLVTFPSAFILNVIQAATGGATGSVVGALSPADAFSWTMAVGLFRALVRPFKVVADTLTAELERYAPAGTVRNVLSVTGMTFLNDMGFSLPWRVAWAIMDTLPLLFAADAAPPNSGLATLYVFHTIANALYDLWPMFLSGCLGRISDYESLKSVTRTMNYIYAAFYIFFSIAEVVNSSDAPASSFNQFMTTTLVIALNNASVILSFLIEPLRLVEQPEILAYVIGALFVIDIGFVIDAMMNAPTQADEKAAPA